GVTVTATQGLAFTATVANLSDANPTDPAAAFTATIGWGDFTTDTGVVAGGAGTFAVSGTHTYASVGVYLVTVSIVDTVSGATATATSTANITAGTGLAASGVVFSASQGVAFTGIVANVTDAVPSETTTALTATISWGDGMTSPGVVLGSSGLFAVRGTHTYA